MSKADLSIQPKLLKSAKNEFLDKGFKEASLKDICKAAEVTTGALYKRYKSKEDLFCAVVQQTVDDLEKYIESRKESKLENLSDKDLIQAWSMADDNMLGWFKYLYDRYDSFLLLIDKAEGTRYSNFKHDWCEIMSHNTYKYYLEAKKRKLTDVEISEKEMHVWMSAFWTAVYEPFVHNFTWEEILIHNNFMGKLFDWYKFLNFSEIGKENN